VALLECFQRLAIIGVVVAVCLSTQNVLQARRGLLAAAAALTISCWSAVGTHTNVRRAFLTPATRMAK
jgi:hypothetical protein